MRWYRLLALALAGYAVPLTGCSDCGCDERYQDCIENAPPGASKADCAQELQECEDACEGGRTAQP